VDAPILSSRLAELELAFARSRRAAAVRRSRAARHTAVSRRVLRSLTGLLIAVIGLFAASASVATAPVVAPAPKPAPWNPARCPAAGAFVGAFRTASFETGVPVTLLVAVAWEESRMKQDAVSPAGARGLLQLMPATATVVGVQIESPSGNILAGARYLRQMLARFDGNLELALSAYNAGPSAVAMAGAAPTIETLRYAKNIEARARVLANCG
jgi:soluble lytic murein transglycosylase-like protein